MCSGSNTLRKASIHHRLRLFYPLLLHQGLPCQGWKQAAPLPATCITGPSLRELKEKLGVSGKKILILQKKSYKLLESLLCGLLDEQKDLLSSMAVQLVSKRNAGDWEKIIIWICLNFFALQTGGWWTYNLGKYARHRLISPTLTSESKADPWPL